MLPSRRRATSAPTGSQEASKAAAHSRPLEDLAGRVADAPLPQTMPPIRPTSSSEPTSSPAATSGIRVEPQKTTPMGMTVAPSNKRHFIYWFVLDPKDPKSPKFMLGPHFKKCKPVARTASDWEKIADTFRKQYASIRHKVDAEKVCDMRFRKHPKTGAIQFYILTTDNYPKYGNPANWINNMDEKSRAKSRHPVCQEALDQLKRVRKECHIDLTKMGTKDEQPYTATIIETDEDILSVGVPYRKFYGAKQIQLHASPKGGPLPPHHANYNALISGTIEYRRRYEVLRHGSPTEGIWETIREGLKAFPGFKQHHNYDADFPVATIATTAHDPQEESTLREYLDYPIFNVDSMDIDTRHAALEEGESRVICIPDRRELFSSERPSADQLELESRPILATVFCDSEALSGTSPSEFRGKPLYLQTGRQRAFAYGPGGKSHPNMGDPRSHAEVLYTDGKGYIRDYKNTGPFVSRRDYGAAKRFNINPYDVSKEVFKYADWDEKPPTLVDDPSAGLLVTEARIEDRIHEDMERRDIEKLLYDHIQYYRTIKVSNEKAGINQTKIRDAICSEELADQIEDNPKDRDPKLIIKIKIACMVRYMAALIALGPEDKLTLDMPDTDSPVCKIAASVIRNIHKACNSLIHSGRPVTFANLLNIFLEENEVIEEPRENISSTSGRSMDSRGTTPPSLGRLRGSPLYRTSLAARRMFSIGFTPTVPHPDRLRSSSEREREFKRIAHPRRLSSAHPIY